MTEIQAVSTNNAAATTQKDNSYTEKMNKEAKGIVLFTDPDATKPNYADKRSELITELLNYHDRHGVPLDKESDIYECNNSELEKMVNEAKKHEQAAKEAYENSFEVKARKKFNNLLNKIFHKDNK